jgi:dihydroflavonol-4-reductase
MKIAVTGASGHVGVNLCSLLLEKGHQVKALIHNHPHRLRITGLEICKGDILAPDSLESFTEGADIVIHLAARISVTGDKDGKVYQTNVDGTRHVLDAAVKAKVSRFIHFSSIHAFNQHPLTLPLDETRPLAGSGSPSYDQSKAEGERLVMRAAENGLHAVILSPTAIIGPQDPEPSLIGKAVIDLYNKKIPCLVPGGYDWVDVRDVARAAIEAMTRGHKGEKYLLSGQWASLKELSALIAKVTGITTIQRVIPSWVALAGLPVITGYAWLSGGSPLYTKESLRAIREGNRMISHEKAVRQLGFSSRPLEETIQDLVTWMIQNRMIQNRKTK